MDQTCGLDSDKINCFATKRTINIIIESLNILKEVMLVLSGLEYGASNIIEKNYCQKIKPNLKFILIAKQEQNFHENIVVYVHVLFGTKKKEENASRTI